MGVYLKIPSNGVPAGCITLENGAKNLETKIEYEVIASA